MKPKKVQLEESEPPGAVAIDLEQTRSFLVDEKAWEEPSKLLDISQLKLEIVSDIGQAKNLWREFSTNQSLFDTWEFRYAFWLGYKHTPHFMVLKTDMENWGILPLWFEADKQKYFWFGSWWHEDNKFMVKDKRLIPFLMAAAPTPLLLNAIDNSLDVWLHKLFKFLPDDPKFVLRLKGMTGSEDFLKTLNKKRRYNLKRDRRLINELNPKIYINRFEDFDKMVSLSTRRFAEKNDEADWVDKRRVETFRQIIRLSSKKSYQVRMISIEIEGEIAAADLMTIHKGIYYPLKCGNDIKRFPGIGNYMNLLEIDDAIELKMQKMDFLEINYGWKDKWFEEVPLLQYISS